MNLPDDIRDQLRGRMWRIADEIGWLALGPTEKTQHYENWTKDPEVGTLQRYIKPHGRLLADGLHCLLGPRR